MKVVPCGNCNGFGHTLGPVLVPVYDEAPAAFLGDETVVTDALAEETAVYRCLACDGAGYLQIA